MSRHIQTVPLSITIDPGTVFISTNPDQSSYANLTVSIKNTGNTTVPVSAIAITLPAALAPATSLNSITLIAGQSGWNFGPSEINTGEFDATPANGKYAGIDPGSTWSFELQMVTLVSTIIQSSADVTVAIFLEDGSSSSTPLNINIAPAVAGILEFNAQPASISLGESATLNWACEKIDHCIINPISGDHVQSSGTLEVAPQSTTIYTLYAYGDGVILSAQWAVSVENPQIIFFGGVGGQSSVDYGDNITLDWNCNQFTTRITLTNDAGITIPPLLENGNNPQKGSITVGPLIRPVTFTFKAFGDSNPNPDQSNPPFTINDLFCTFTASPGSDIWTGDSVTLAWNIQSVSAVSISPSIDNGPSLQNLVGSTVINPSNDVTYVLNVSGYVNDLPVTNQQYTIPLQVQQVVINSFTTTPDPIMPGKNPNQATLAWNVQAQSVSINNGIGAQPLVGSVALSAPANGTTYILTAGTNLNPGLVSLPAVVSNGYGPFTFNGINNGPPGGYGLIDIALIVSDQAAMRIFPQLPNLLFFINITGVVPIGITPPVYSGIPLFDPELSPPQWAFGIIGSTNGLTGFNWADPNNPTGTITVTGVENFTPTGSNTTPIGSGDSDGELQDYI